MAENKNGNRDGRKRVSLFTEVDGADKKALRRSGRTTLSEAVAPAANAKDVRRASITANEHGQPTVTPVPEPGEIRKDAK